MRIVKYANSLIELNMRLSIVIGSNNIQSENQFLSISVKPVKFHILQVCFNKTKNERFIKNLPSFACLRFDISHWQIDLN